MLMINLAERLLLDEFRHAAYASQGHLNFFDWKMQKKQQKWLRLWA